ncbi:uncharacterized protein LOC105789666 [Gossypium raimondii]|nr:uncharacterized protein LOC105789666 [Gossypium raimondii]
MKVEESVKLLNMMGERILPGSYFQYPPPGFPSVSPHRPSSIPTDLERVYIRGKGSVKDSVKEEKLKDKPGFEHLNEPLHVLVEAELPKDVINSQAKVLSRILLRCLKEFGFVVWGLKGLSSRRVKPKVTFKSRCLKCFWRIIDQIILSSPPNVLSPLPVPQTFFSLCWFFGVVYPIFFPIFGFQSSFLIFVPLPQSQSVDVFPKKALESLRDIKDIGAVLLELSKEFNIDRFLAIQLEALVDQSSYDDSYHLALISVIDSVPLRNLVDPIVSKILLTCMKLSERDGKLVSSESITWAKNVLATINKNYPSQFHGAAHEFLEDAKVQSKKEDTVCEFLSKILDGNLNLSIAFSESKIWFASHHPKRYISA